MQAGKLRHLVNIEQPVYATAGDYGNKPKTWRVYATGVWCSIEPISGRDYEQAKGFGATINHKITMRYRIGVSPTFRINFKGRLFYIVGPLSPDERDRSLVMYATEKVSDAAG